MIEVHVTPRDKLEWSVVMLLFLLIRLKVPTGRKPLTGHFPSDAEIKVYVERLCIGMYE